MQCLISICVTKFSMLDFFFAVVFFVQTYDDLFGSKSWKSFTFETDSYALNNNNNKSIGYVYFT